MFLKLSDKYDEAYQAHLVAFQQKFVSTFPDPEKSHYTDFYPSIGIAEGKSVDLVVYGQAVGGWQKELDMRKEVPKRRVDVSRKFSNHHFKGDSPIDWVNARWTPSELAKVKNAPQWKYYKQKDSTYWANRSFFWQVTYKFLEAHLALEVDSWNWSKHLVWSNLYKIAPQTANPTEADRILQRPLSVDLVRLELQELKPRLCIVLTNYSWWSHFHRGLPTTSVKHRAYPTVEAVERFEETTIIVVKRPRFGSAPQTVEDLLLLTKKLGLEPKRNPRA